jgi:hypothetical protein
MPFVEPDSFISLKAVGVSPNNATSAPEIKAEQSNNRRRTAILRIKTP